MDSKITFDELDEVTCILPEDVDIGRVMRDLINQSGFGIEYIDIDKYSIKRFKHPTKSIMVEPYNDFDERKNVICEINKKYCGGFGQFYNQQWAGISLKLMGMIEQLPTSSYNCDTFDLINKYEPLAMLDTLKDSADFVAGGEADDMADDLGECPIKGLDAYKQYASIFKIDYQHPDFYIPVYDVHCDIELFDGEVSCGEFYIKQCSFHGVRFGGYFVHYFVIQQLLKMGAICGDDISYQLKTNKKFKPSCFKEYVEQVAKFGNVAFKKLCNFLNGQLKGTVNRKGNAYFTNDPETLAYLITDATIKEAKYIWNTYEESGYHVFKLMNETNNYENTSSFYRACLSCSILQTLRMVGKVAAGGGEIVKVKTDAVFFVGGSVKPDVLSGSILDDLGKWTSEEFTSEFVCKRYQAKEL